MGSSKAQTLVAPGLGVPEPRPVPSLISRSDRLFRTGVKTVGLSTLVLLILIGVFLLIKGYPALHSQGLGFLTNTGWQTHPTAHGPPRFGIRIALIGTVVVSVLALILALPVALASALFISEYAPPWLKGPATALVDLLAAVPSIIYGLWGFAFLSGHMTGLVQWLADHLAFIPLFHVTTPLYTSSQFIAGAVVGLMVVPIITSVTREVFSLTPPAEREAAMALGASQATVIRRVVLPFGRGGLIGAVMLGLGRAMGETIAVAIILSLSFSNPWHILQSGGTTIAALIAIENGSGGKTLGLASLAAAGLVLFVLTLGVNLVASRIVSRSRGAAAVEL